MTVHVTVSGSLAAPATRFGEITHFTVAGTERVAVLGQLREKGFYLRCRARSEYADALIAALPGSAVTLYGELWRGGELQNPGSAYTRTHALKLAGVLAAAALIPDRQGGLRARTGLNAVTFSGPLLHASVLEWDDTRPRCTCLLDLPGGPFRLSASGAAALTLAGRDAGEVVAGTARQDRAARDGPDLEVLHAESASG